MLESDPVKKTSLSTEIHSKFFKQMSDTGKQDYSIVDTTGKGVIVYTKKE